MKIAILLFDRFTCLDAIGPYQVLSGLPGAEVSFVAERPGPISADFRTATSAPLCRPGSCWLPGVLPSLKSFFQGRYRRQTWPR
jgi:putative intracellular protease/amidase